MGQRNGYRLCLIWTRSVRNLSFGTKLLIPLGNSQRNSIFLCVFLYTFHLKIQYKITDAGRQGRCPLKILKTISVISRPMVRRVHQRVDLLLRVVKRVRGGLQHVAVDHFPNTRVQTDLQSIRWNHLSRTSASGCAYFTPLPSWIAKKILDGCRVK